MSNIEAYKNIYILFLSKRKRRLLPMALLYVTANLCWSRAWVKAECSAGNQHLRKRKMTHTPIHTDMHKYSAQTHKYYLCYALTQVIQNKYFFLIFTVHYILFTFYCRF